MAIRFQVYLTSWWFFTKPFETYATVKFAMSSPRFGVSSYKSLKPLPNRIFYQLFGMASARATPEKMGDCKRIIHICIYIYCLLKGLVFSMLPVKVIDMIHVATNNAAKAGASRTNKATIQASKDFESSNCKTFIKKYTENVASRQLSRIQATWKYWG